MFKKIFLAILALGFIFVGSCSLLMGYLFFNPSVVGSGFSWVSNQAFKTHPFEEKQEFYIQGIKKIQVLSEKIPVRLEVHNGPTLQLEITGKVQGDVKSLVFQKAEGDSLQIQLMTPETFSAFHMQINGKEYSSSQTSEVSAILYLPHSYAEKMVISTTEAPVEIFLPTNYYVQLELRSESGQVQNKWEPATLPPGTEVKVGLMEVQSQKGSISVQDQNL